MPAKTTGYSGTPLAKKLGFKPDTSVALIGAPPFMRSVVGEAGAKAQPTDKAKGVKGPVAAAHVFTTEEAVLKAALPVLMKAIARDGMIWVSWPKKASKVPTDITEDTIRKLALPLGLVDVKVCAVDDVWSGLKLMIRKENR
ncbi:MAG: hypothetical protein JNK21_09690 [Rhodospirillaceae bacterium]|nr:hypothetical protein [Rhodospirillaceae bacterium]